MNYNTTFWSRFTVKSRGRFDEKKGYISKRIDTFDPTEITQLLKTEPEHVCVYGNHKEGISNPESVYMFSGWFSQKIKEPPIDRGEHCHSIIRMLAPYEKELIEYKQEHGVNYEITFVVYDGDGTDIIIDSEVIDFCSKLSIEIRFETFLMSN